MSQTLQYAQDYFRAGYCIIPINQTPGDANESKRPALKGWKQYQTTRPTFGDLNTWFGNGRPRNIAIITGLVSNGLTVLDFDNAEAYHRWATAYPELNAPTASTGRGFHVYIKVGDITGNGKLYFEGVQVGDIKTDGGYVVAPPSVHGSGRRYEWLMPPWDTETPIVSRLSDIGLSNAPPQPERRTGGAATPTGGIHPYVKTAFDGELTTLAAATQGERNNVLVRAAYTLGGWIGGGYLNRAEVEAALTQIA